MNNTKEMLEQISGLFKRLNIGGKIVVCLSLILWHVPFILLFIGFHINNVFVAFVLALIAAILVLFYFAVFLVMFVDLFIILFVKK